MNFLSSLAAKAAAAPAPAPKAEVPSDVSAVALNAAALVYDELGDRDRARTCRDLAAKRARYGEWASDKQANFAAMLVKGAESKPDEALNPMIPELLAAARVFDSRDDQFAYGKGDTCRDLAGKLRRYGSFASPAQEGFAKKLIEWSKPREAKPANENSFEVPLLFAVMQKHAEIFAEPLKLSRRNQDSLVWVSWSGVLVGKIDNGRVELWSKKAAAGRVDLALVRERLMEFEANPLAAAVKYGRLSGRCCSCGRDLTNEGSIEAGIGPICAQKFL